MKSDFVAYLVIDVRHAQIYWLSSFNLISVLARFLPSVCSLLVFYLHQNEQDREQIGRSRSRNIIYLTNWSQTFWDLEVPFYGTTYSAQPIIQAL